MQQRKEKQLQAMAQKLVDSADMKAKEADIRTDVATLKALLIGVQYIMKKISRDHEERSPKARRGNQENGRETTSQLIGPTSYWIYYSCDRPFPYVIYIVM